MFLCYKPFSFALIFVCLQLVVVARHGWFRGKWRKRTVVGANKAQRFDEHEILALPDVISNSVGKRSCSISIPSWLVVVRNLLVDTKITVSDEDYTWWRFDFLESFRCCFRFPRGIPVMKKHMPLYLFQKVREKSTTRSNKRTGSIRSRRRTATTWWSLQE